MKLSTILDLIDHGNFGLPMFQRGYVWNRDQVRALFDSLYRRHPVGALLLWSTEVDPSIQRGASGSARGKVDLILDGQQRLTTIYGVKHGKAPKFFEGDTKTFTGLHFNVAEEKFEFYKVSTMRDDPLWVDVTALLSGKTDISKFSTNMMQVIDDQEILYQYMDRMNKLRGISDTDVHAEYITETIKDMETVVDIFNRVNSGGTKLSKGDLALAKICASWPEARQEMQSHLNSWSKCGYKFGLDWLLRTICTCVTGEAQFQHLHNYPIPDLQKRIPKVAKIIDQALNMIDGRLGLDHDQVLFAKNAFPVICRYLDQCGNEGLDQKKQDLLLFWYLQAGMWGRFSGSSIGVIDQDLEQIKDSESGLENLLRAFLNWRGSFRVEPQNFYSWSLGSRFYPILYMLTVTGSARDLKTGLPLKKSMVGAASKLEVHHIFPKSRLYKQNVTREWVNQLANYCLLTSSSNKSIGDQLPEKYFPEVEALQPGVLKSQWIPMDESLWQISNYKDFFSERQKLLAEETNRRLSDYLHGDNTWLKELGAEPDPVEPALDSRTSDDNLDEDIVIRDMITWSDDRGISRGIRDFDLQDQSGDDVQTVLDLAWPDGIQQGLSQPVAVLINEPRDVLERASASGFRCFTSPSQFKEYVETELGAEPLAE